MGLIRFDYEYYIEPNSGIGFSEKSRKELRELINYIGNFEYRLDYENGPWKASYQKRNSMISIGVKGTPRAMVSINCIGRFGDTDDRKMVCNYIDGMLINIQNADLVPYVYRDTIPEYILNADDGKTYRTDSYDRKEGHFTEEKE